MLLVCFFTCGILLHLPMYAAAYAGEHLSWLKALLGARTPHPADVRAGRRADPIHEFARSRPAVWSDLYFGAAIAVYLVSPLLTFSVVLSFFKNLSALWRFRRCTELYVFSELNEDSLYLAGSIKAAHPKGLVVFTHGDQQQIDGVVGGRPSAHCPAGWGNSGRRAFQGGGDVRGPPRPRLPDRHFVQ